MKIRPLQPAFAQVRCAGEVVGQTLESRKRSPHWKNRNIRECQYPPAYEVDSRPMCVTHAKTAALQHMLSVTERADREEKKNEGNR